MTVTQIRSATTPQLEPTDESERVAKLQEMIRSGRYEGYLDELTDELAKAKGARNEMRALTAMSALAA
jgi:hypothetical protein